MAMEFVERQLRASKDPRDQERADVVAAMLKARGKDITLPQVVVKETTPVEVRRFSQEAREALEKQGFVVRELTGQSIASEREAGRKFWSTWHRDYPQFEALSSMQSEVAINPAKLFLPRSNNKTLRQQEDLIARFSTDLGTKVQGVEAVMGEAADYVDLAFAHLDVTGDRLFGENYGYNYARTKTPTVDSNVASVGGFHPVDGLDVRYWSRGYGRDDVFAAPLVVPKA